MPPDWRTGLDLAQGFRDMYRKPCFYPTIYPIQCQAGRLAELDRAVQSEPLPPGLGIAPRIRLQARNRTESALGEF